MLSYGDDWLILRLAVSVEHRLVTDGQTDTRRQLRAGKNVPGVVVLVA